MKRGILLAGLVTVLCLAPAYAKAEQLGVYVTPKLVYGATIMDNTKAYGETNWDGGSGGQTFKISNGSDSAFGGSLAVGYNFDKRFSLPIRAELEYAIFSEVENKGSKGNFARSAYDSYNYKETFDQKFGIQTLFFNAYYDFHTGTAFTPYVGGGLGVAFINTKAKYKYENSYTYGGTTDSDSESVSTGSKTRSNFAWNIGAGLAYDFTENLALDLGYRFVGLGSAKTQTRTWLDEDGDPVSFHGKTQDLYMHQVSLGLRVSF